MIHDVTSIANMLTVFGIFFSSLNFSHSNSNFEVNRSYCFTNMPMLRMLEVNVFHLCFGICTFEGTKMAFLKLKLRMHFN